MKLNGEFDDRQVSADLRDDYTSVEVAVVMPPKRVVVANLLLLVSAGCAAINNPRDPFEPMNRATYHFNDGLDKAVMKPLATAYKGVLPAFVRTGVTNFYNNLYDVSTALNDVLQGKITDAASDAGRVTVNTTFGLLGFLDVGTAIGLEKHNEDFGQTLGRWGISDGPYLQIPVLGPSSFRDGIGMLIDFKTNPVGWIWRDHVATRNSLWGLYDVNLRTNLLDAAKMLDEAALDAYEFQRDAYLQRRRYLVYDGNPPPEKNQDDISELNTKPRSESGAPGNSAGDALGAPPLAPADATPTEAQPSTLVAAPHAQVEIK